MVTIKPNAEALEILNSVEDLELLFIVSKLVITESDINGLDLDSGSILVEKYDHVECERCRKYFEEKDIVKISLEEEHNICVTCNEIIK